MDNLVLILKNHTFSPTMTNFWPIFPEVVQMVSLVTFCEFVQPKIGFITLGKPISAKMSGQNSEIKEIFPVIIFFVVDGLVSFCCFWTFKLLLFRWRKKLLKCSCSVIITCWDNWDSGSLLPFTINTFVPLAIDIFGIGL